MSLDGTKLIIFKRDGSSGGTYQTKDKSITIGADINCDIRLKIPEADPCICKITLDSCGRAKLSNICNKPIYVNDKLVEQKHILKNEDMISILNKQFQWKDERKTKNRANEGTLVSSGLEKKELQSRTSVPSKASRLSVKTNINNFFSKFSKRMTVNSFKFEQSKNEDKASTAEPTLSNSSSVKLNKENLTPSKNIQANLNMSGTMIVSFSPVITPFSERFGTPISEFSESNDSSFASLNSTLTETQEKKNSSMYLIDLTTPANVKFSKSSVNKTSIENNFISTPTNRVKTSLLRSAIKRSSNMMNHDLTIPKENSKDENEETSKALNLTGVGCLSNTPVKTLMKGSIRNVGEQLIPTSSKKEEEEENTRKKQLDEEVIQEDNESECKILCISENKKNICENQDLPKINEPDWIKSVIKCNKDSNETTKPNNKSQILSERYSNITPDTTFSPSVRSNVNANVSQILSISPILKFIVSDDKTTESLDISSEINESEYTQHDRVKLMENHAEISNIPKLRSVVSHSTPMITRLDWAEANTSTSEKDKILCDSVCINESIQIEEKQTIFSKSQLDTEEQSCDLYTSMKNTSLNENPGCSNTILTKSPHTTRSIQVKLRKLRSDTQKSFIDDIAVQKLGIITPKQKAKLMESNSNTELKGKILRSEFKKVLKQEVTKRKHEKLFCKIENSPIDTESNFLTPDLKSSANHHKTTSKTEVKKKSLRSDFKNKLIEENKVELQNLFENMKDHPIDPNIAFSTPIQQKKQKIFKTNTELKGKSLRSDFQKILNEEVIQQKHLESFSNMKEGPIDAGSGFLTPDLKTNKNSEKTKSRTETKDKSLRSDFEQALIVETVNKKEKQQNRELLENMKDGPICPDSKFLTPYLNKTKNSNKLNTKTEIKSKTLRSDFKKKLIEENKFDNRYGLSSILALKLEKNVFH
uniref:CSON007387 protein n=1 Tax=Culicoides sonorensis TaxID=179676 RepID=A0A336LWY8_CULSO